MDIRLGQTVKGLRQEMGITQEQLGNHLGISYQAVSKWESGATLPDISLLPKIATFFCVTIDDLFSIGPDDHLTRIDRMLEDEFRCSPDKLAYARRILDQAIAQNPDDPELHRRLASVTAGNWARDLRASIQHIEQAIALSPFNETYHFMLQDARKRLLEPEQLTQFYNRFIVQYPNWPQGYVYLSMAYMDDRKLRRAMSAIEQGLGACPNDPHLCYLIGDIQLMLGDEEGALAAWRGVINEYPDNWRFVNNTADRLAELERYDEAFEMWERALELDPRNGSPLYSAAFAYDAIGEYGKAIERWERIIDLLKGTYGITEGESVDWPHREIERLRTKASSKAIS